MIYICNIHILYGNIFLYYINLDILLIIMHSEKFIYVTYISRYKI
jgi:hypothetical protein